MSLLDLGFTKAYRTVERAVVNEYHRCKNQAIARHYLKTKAERASAEMNLLGDDLRFHGVPPCVAAIIAKARLERLGEEKMPHSYIGEDFPEDL